MKSAHVQNPNEPEITHVAAANGGWPSFLQDTKFLQKQEMGGFLKR